MKIYGKSAKIIYKLKGVFYGSLIFYMYSISNFEHILYNILKCKKAKNTTLKFF